MVDARAGGAGRRRAGGAAGARPTSGAGAGRRCWRRCARTTRARPLERGRRGAGGADVRVDGRAEGRAADRLTAVRASARRPRHGCPGPGDWVLALPAHPRGRADGRGARACWPGGADRSSWSPRRTRRAGSTRRSFAAATAEARGAGATGGRPLYISLVPTQLDRLLDAGADLRRVRRGPARGAAAAPAELLDRAPGRGCAGRDHVRHDRDVRRLRLRRRPARGGRRAVEPIGRRPDGSGAARRPDAVRGLPAAAGPHGGGVRRPWTASAPPTWAGGTVTGCRCWDGRRRDRHRRGEGRARRGSSGVSRSGPGRASARGASSASPDGEWGERVVAPSLVRRPPAARHPTLADLRRCAPARDRLAAGWLPAGGRPGARRCRCSRRARSTGPSPCASTWVARRRRATGDHRRAVGRGGAPAHAAGRGRAGGRRHGCGRSGRRRGVVEGAARARRVASRCRSASTTPTTTATACAAPTPSGSGRCGWSGSGVAPPRRRCGAAALRRLRRWPALLGLVLAATSAWWLLLVGAACDARGLVLHRRPAPVRVRGPRRGVRLRVLRAGRGLRHDVRAGGPGDARRRRSARWRWGCWPARSWWPTTCATSRPTRPRASARWRCGSVTPARAGSTRVLVARAVRWRRCCSAVRGHPWALLGLAALPLQAARRCGGCCGGASGRDLIPVLRDTGGPS